jgi:hypothetical protein
MPRSSAAFVYKASLDLTRTFFLHSYKSFLCRKAYEIHAGFTSQIPMSSTSMWGLFSAFADFDVPPVSTRLSRSSFIQHTCMDQLIFPVGAKLMRARRPQCVLMNTSDRLEQVHQQQQPYISEVGNEQPAHHTFSSTRILIPKTCRTIYDDEQKTTRTGRLYIPLPEA